jgi:hypothetical protein
MVCESCRQTSVEHLQGVSLLLKHLVIHFKINVYSFRDDNVQAFDNLTLLNSKYREFLKEKFSFSYDARHEMFTTFALLK